MAAIIKDSKSKAAFVPRSGGNMTLLASGESTLELTALRWDML
jgi:hypothetical protein